MMWFTSDQHYSHRNIILYCGRPFISVEEMNEVIIENFNNLVKIEDTVYHLGDFSLNDKLVGDFLSRLNGKHYLICGNHDRCHPCHRKNEKSKRKYFEAGFLEIEVRKVIEVEKLGPVLLTHMPRSNMEDPRYEEYRPNDWGGWIFHGHVHERYQLKDNQFNVGVDVNDFKPINLENIISIIKNQKIIK